VAAVSYSGIRLRRPANRLKYFELVKLSLKIVTGQLVVPV